MRLLTLGFLLAAAAAPAARAAPISAAEFEALVTGRTLQFELFGRPFGAEQYKPGRRVVWAPEGGACVEGGWYESAGNICFEYDGDPNPICWAFSRQDGQMSATVTDDPDFTLTVSGDSDRPPVCPGPDVGA